MNQILIKIYAWFINLKFPNLNLRQKLTNFLDWIFFPQKNFSESTRRIPIIISTTLLLGFWSAGFLSTHTNFNPDYDTIATKLQLDTTQLLIEKTPKKNLTTGANKKTTRPKVNSNLYIPVRISAPDTTNGDTIKTDSITTNFRLGEREFLQQIIKRDCNLRSYGNLQNLPDKIFFTMIEEIERYQIPYTIFFRVVDRESGFRFVPNAKGSGAFGYCQVIPSTFRNISKKLGFKTHNEVNNIKAGAWLLRHNYNIYAKKGYTDEQCWYKALVDYSGGNHKLAREEMQGYKPDLLP